MIGATTIARPPETYAVNAVEFTSIVIVVEFLATTE
jgi:hypothetical protein